MKNSYPKSGILRGISSSETPHSPKPSPLKPKSSRRSKSGSENVPPPDPNALPESCFSSPSLAGTTKSSAAKIKSPLPPRPPSSNPNPLKRKLNMESIPEIGVPGASDSGVQVIVRMRPPTKEEEEGEPIVHKLSSNSLIILDHMFTFDSIAGTESTQQDIFQLLGVPLVEHCLAGFNSSIFAYGQTGSGKTFTMWGPPNALAEKNSSNDQQGLTPRVFERLFARINEEQVKHADKQLTYQCRCSFLEIYNEHITDLLDPNQRNLQIREDVKSGVYVENLTEEYVCKMKDLNQLLMKGLANRRTGSTSINAESSRSHSVFTCVVDSRCKSMADGLSSLKTSRINLVDLAGSERQKLTGAAGERLKEAGNINRSLSQLGNLINILAEVSQSGKQRHIPYRDSRLTFLLQESLGGNAKLAMICAISPAQSCKSETFSTLRFAQRAKAIKNNAVVNEITQDDVNVLREQIRQLKEELLRMKSNGIPTDSNGVYSTGWNARRSLNLLRFSLNRPRTLPRVENDSDEEMEIDEEDVERLCVQVGLQSAAIGANNNNFNKLPVQSDSQAIACEEIKDLKVTVSTNIGNGCGNDQGFDEADTNMEDCRLEEMASNQLDKHVIVDDHEMPVVNASVCWDDLNHQGHTAPNDEKHTTHKTNTDSLVGEIAEEAIKKKPLVSLDCELHDGISLEGNPVEAQSSTCLDSKSVAGDSAETSVMDPSSHNPPANSSDSVLPSSLSIVPCLDSKSVCGDSAESSVTDPPSHNPTADSPLPVLPSSVVPCHLSPVLQSPTLSISPKVDDKKSGKSLRISQKDLPEASRLSSEVPKLSLAESLRSSSSTQSIKKSLAPTENLAASLHRGLQIIDTHQQSSALRRSSFRFSFKPAELKPLLSVDKVNVGIQTVPQESERQEDSSAFMCSYCKSRTPQLESKETNDSTELQLVPVDGSQFGEKSKKQVPKAVEKVLAGAIRREMALDELCAKQTTEIAHLNRLVQQYKHERECNAIIEQTREDKICRLEGLMDGVITTEEFMEEEFMSLTNEHKLLKEKYENHPEVLRTNIELKRVQDELDGYRNFFDMGERDVLMEEIQHLRSQLQYYIDSSPMSTRKRSPLLQLTCSTEPIAAPLSTIPESAEESVEEAPLSIIPESAEGSAEEKFELERQCWTEAESKWISLSEELRLELEESRSLAEKRRQGLDSEKKCSEELKEALQMAMQGHARILEQYADLQEKHIAMLARHRMIRDGITDVKRAAAKAGVKGAESKFIDSLAAEISALKVEREKEMRYLRDENRGLQTQLSDTAEAVQAAGELLVRLKEAEEAVVIAQKHAVMAEQKAEIAHQEMDKLKKKHETEINTLNQFLAESRLPKEALCPAYNAADMGKYDRGEESLTDQRWREEFEPFCQVDSEFARWSTGYDRCNI